jgi:tetratricopeptide (TPR) repeat protein
LAAAPSRSALEQALALRRRSAPPSDPGVIQCLDRLALLSLRQERGAEALWRLERSVALREGLPAADPATLAVRLDQLGGLYLKQNRLADAETALTRALRLSVTALGPGDPSVMARSMRLADLYLKHGKRPPGGGDDLTPLKRTVKLAPLALRARSAERAR